MTDMQVMVWMVAVATMAAAAMVFAVCKVWTPEFAYDEGDYGR